MTHSVEASYYRGIYKGDIPANFDLFSDNSNTDNMALLSIEGEDFFEKFSDVDNNKLENKNIFQILGNFFKMDLKEFLRENLSGENNKAKPRTPSHSSTEAKEVIKFKNEDLSGTLIDNDNNEINENNETKENNESSENNNTPLETNSYNNYTATDINNNINKRILNLFYENKFSEEKYTKNLLCLKDEELFYTPIAYEKMGVALLISVLDYEGLNPFSKIKKSEHKEVKVLRSATAQHIYNTNERYKNSLYYQNMYKNISTQKSFKSFYEKFFEKIFLSPFTLITV